MNFIFKILGFSESQPDRTDDFFDFINATSGDKVKVMRQVLREATDEQRNLLEKYKANALEKEAA